ncbi:hypothetical protein MHYP_G00268060 [Metynnis hypsauchen]
MCIKVVFPAVGYTEEEGRDLLNSDLYPASSELFKMTKMEHLNSFFIERLMSVAAEIFEAIQDTVSEYQVEMERAKRENRRLRERLTEINSCNSGEQQTPSSADVQLNHADGAPLLQSSNQGLLDSDPSVLQLKLEVATMKQEGDQSSRAVPHELPTLSQESLDSKSSFIQVKVEFSTMHQDTEPQGPLNNPTSSSSPSAETVNTKDPLHNCLGITVKEEKVDDGPHNTGSTVKLQPLDSQVIFSNDAPSVMQRENVTENHWEGLRDDQVAGEIFEAVKDTVSEYQDEIERTKQENRRLREILTEISLSASSEIRAADVRHSRAGGAPLEQDSNQRPLNSDPSVLQLKLELATIKQEAEPQLPLNDAPTSTSPCAKSAHDTWTSHADGVLLEQQNSSQGPQDPEPALIQVKLELATLQDEHGPPQLLSKEKHTGDQEPDRSVSFNALAMEGRKDDCLRRDSFIAINSATGKMTKLDAFNSFLRERLFGVAEEIFQAVQEIVCEQQDELKRAQEEICLLRRELAAASLNKEIGFQASHPEGLCTEQQQSQNEPVSSESSLIQVKLELCALQQDAEPQLLNSVSTCSSSSSVKSTDVQKKTLCLPPKPKESEGLKMNSYISINLVPCDALLHSESLNSSAVKHHTARDGRVAERLIAAADEIFQVVKDTISEYQEEIERAQQENRYLRDMLVSINSSGEERRDIQPCHADESQPNQELPDSEPMIQVKLELCTVQQELEPQQPLTVAPCTTTHMDTALNQEPLPCLPAKSMHTEEKECTGLLGDPVPVKAELCDSQATCTENSDSSAAQREQESAEYFEVDEGDPSSGYSLLNALPDHPSRTQNDLADSLFYCKVCNKPFKTYLWLEKHMADKVMIHYMIMRQV